jgi:transposase
MRKTKLTKEMIDKIATFIANGNYVETACKALGIGQSTYYEWMKKGREGKKPYAELAETVKKAEAIAEAKRIQTILMASEETWQAAAWYLERRYPERWGQKKRGDDSDDHNIKLKELVDAIREAASVQSKTS